jgi:hypothetical protein
MSAFFYDAEVIKAAMTFKAIIVSIIAFNFPFVILWYLRRQLELLLITYPKGKYRFLYGMVTFNPFKSEVF